MNSGLPRTSSRIRASFCGLRTHSNTSIADPGLKPLPKDPFQYLDLASEKIAGALDPEFLLVIDARTALALVVP